MKIAVITGASSGIGREFVRQVAAGECLDEIWVIARREQRLRELAEEVKLPIRPVPLDLTKQESFERYRALLERERPDVRLLINAAGFGKIGNYAAVTREDVDGMIALNCRAAVEMTVLTLPYMSEGGRILEIASTSAFQPFQQLGVYAASKAFLLRYSRALRWELFPRKIHVTAVCPYWVRGTEFIPTAKETEDPAAVRSFPFAGRAPGVVRRALRASRRNFAVSTPGLVCSLHRVIAKWIPHCALMAGWELLRRIGDGRADYSVRGERRT